MIEAEPKIENKTKDIKLYSLKAITGATFLGGPLAAGYLIGENYKALSKPIEGRYSLVIGIITTIILMVGIFMLPEYIIDKIPRQFIPLIYTVIIWGIVEWKQGDILKNHKANNNVFFSGWRAFGIGVISTLIILIGILGFTFLIPDNELYEQYDTEIAEFTKNETETLVFYDHLKTETNDYLLQELENTIIPTWRKNIYIIKKTNSIENLPPELIEQNKLLLKYSELRIKAFELFKKAIKEDTDKYSQELAQIHLEIDKVLEKLN